MSIGDIRSLHYPDDTFDGVIAVEVLEPIPDPEAGLLEAMRVLKTSGYLITALPVQLPLLMPLYDFDSPDEVLALYEKTGLKIIDFETKEFQRQAGSFINTRKTLKKGSFCSYYVALRILSDFLGTRFLWICELY